MDATLTTIRVLAALALLTLFGCSEASTSPAARVSCESAGFECGALDDGTGRFSACGTCDAPRTCGGAGEVGRCGCTPRTCEMVGSDCGALDDGCGGTIDCGSCAAPDTCGGGGFSNVCGHPVCDGSVCFRAPYPQPDDLFSVFEDQTRGLWTGGAMGRAMRARDTAWDHVDAYTRNPADIEGLWMSGDGDGWAVGSGGRGALLRYDGARFDCSRPDGSYWAELTDEIDVTWDLHAIWGKSADDLWAVGDQGVLHFDGERWIAERETKGRAQLFAITGDGAEQLFAVGRTASDGKPVIMRRYSDGWQTLSTVADDLVGELRTVSISDKGEVWVGGATLDPDGKVRDSLVLRGTKDGAFARVESDAHAMLYASVADGKGGVWFGGASGMLLRASAGGARRVPQLLGRGDIRAMSQGSTGLHAAGQGGMLAVERRGLWWPNRTQALPGEGERVSLWELDPGWVWAGGSGWLMHFDGRRWGTATLPADVVGFFGVAPDALFIAANDAQGGVVYYYDGTTFAEAARTDRPIDSLEGTSSTDVRATSDTQVLHYDGKLWTQREAASFADARAVLPATPSWELDAKAGFVRRSGKQEQLTTWPYQGLEQGAWAAWGTGADDVWAAGPDGVLHLGAATPRLHAVCGTVRALAGTDSAEGLWLAGEAKGADCGPLWRVEDGSIESVPAPLGATVLSSVSVSETGELWVAGDALYQKVSPADAWRPMGPAGTGPFAFVHATRAGEVWAAAGPELFHLRDDAWETLRAWDLFDYPPVGVESEEVLLHDVYSLPSGELFFIGTTPGREAALLLTYMDDEWSSPLPLQAIYGESVFTDVWAASRSEIYVSKGELGYVYKFDATTGSASFDDVTAVMNDPLGALWGSSDGQMWMFGAGGAIVHRAAEP